jgi:hypothetical protein
VIKETGESRNEKRAYLLLFFRFRGEDNLTIPFLKPPKPPKASKVKHFCGVPASKAYLNLSKVA